MKKWIVETLADPTEALVLKEDEKPLRTKGQLLIDTKAAALNFFDILLCQGKYQEKPPLPFTPGAEISGTIVEADEDSKWNVGQKVLARPKLPNGGLAEFVVVGEDEVFAVPEAMSYEEASALFITYQTSYYALHHRAKLQPGEVLLVHAGAGGVGSAAIQLGKSQGATVIATAGGEEKVNQCLEQGADYAIDYKEEDFVQRVKDLTNGKGADVIYDPVGGHVFDRSRKCIAFDGRILIVGFAGGTIPEAPMNHALVKNYSLVGVHWGYYARLYPEGVHDIHEELCRLYEKGDIKPLLYNVFPFDEVPSALTALGNRSTYGKLVIGGTFS
ncbi:NADPH:quinone oxidoreductase family protein [Geomicrobium sediminis]|uniref:NADPH2:quinone reductase n=1 Tax=Geomicrobium sediminis TaxID=1347788 RepID=A0ABS2P7R6_9BACL|nr:NADPH:quinone oxidoreductase family protein [Geomicrobium sediminis]MBM7631349.1 NADPH2:quinone reductase [Geomicrobium sediminis]